MKYLYSLMIVSSGCFVVLLALVMLSGCQATTVTVNVTADGRVVPMNVGVE